MSIHFEDIWNDAEILAKEHFADKEIAQISADTKNLLDQFVLETQFPKYAELLGKIIFNVIALTERRNPLNIAAILSQLINNIKIEKFNK